MKWSAEPLDWYKLLHEAEVVRAWWHAGLASVWQHIHRGDYRMARGEMDRVLGSIACGEWGPPKKVPRDEGAVFAPPQWRGIVMLPAYLADA